MGRGRFYGNMCIFCDIIQKNDHGQILYQDDKVVVFPDIKPASKYHYLVVPKAHIVDAKSLVPDQRPLVEHMIDIAQKMLRDNNCDPTDSRLGFHWPPFKSVNHLHLHVIFPVSSMGFVSRLLFKENSYWFVSPEYVLSTLK